MDLIIVTSLKWFTDRINILFLRDRKIEFSHNAIDTYNFHPVDSSKLKKIDDYCGKQNCFFVAANIMNEEKVDIRLSNWPKT